MTIPALSPMNPTDAAVPFTFDFSNLLATGDRIADVVGVTATSASLSASLTVGTGEVVDGATPGCAVQFTLGSGTTGTTYVVTAEIVTVNGVQLARSAFVPVGVV